MPTNFPTRATTMSQSKFYTGLFLITACTLMLQVIQTRILSVVAWYHLAFFAISMAMFGLTVGAVWVYLRRDRFTEKTLSYDLSYFSTAFALSTLLCLIVQMSLTPMVSRSMTSSRCRGRLSGSTCVAKQYRRPISGPMGRGNRGSGGFVFLKIGYRWRAPNDNAARLSSSSPRDDLRADRDMCRPQWSR